MPASGLRRIWRRRNHGSYPRHKTAGQRANDASDEEIRPDFFADCIRSPVATLLWSVLTGNACKVGIEGYVVLLQGLVLTNSSNSLGVCFVILGKSQALNQQSSLIGRTLSCSTMRPQMYSVFPPSERSRNERSKSRARTVASTSICFQSNTHSAHLQGNVHQTTRKTPHHNPQNK